REVLAGLNDGGLCWMKDEGLHLETSLREEGIAFNLAFFEEVTSMASQVYAGNQDIKSKADKDVENILPGTPHLEDSEKKDSSPPWKSSDTKLPEPQFLVPPGLEHLSKIQHIIIHQEVELLGGQFPI
ncbi:unnamed protein product, partial [Ranitomeya imitator]